MTQRTEIYESVVDTIELIAPGQIDRLQLSGNDTLMGDLALDSMTITSMLALLEEKFSISLLSRIEELADIETVDHLVDFLVPSVTNTLEKTA